MNAPVPSVSSRSGLPRELDPVFERALAKDPNHRFETCADFVAALLAAFDDAAGATGALPVAVPATAATAPLREAVEEEVAWSPPRPPSAKRWPLLAVLLVAGAVAGALLAFVLTRGDGAGEAPTTVVTEFRTVTTQGEVTTVERPVTITTPAAPPASGQSGAALNDAGFAEMQTGDYAGALPLLERAVQRLQGTGSLTEAYASYNLAFTRFQLGNCDGVLELLDRSESIQGQRDEIDRLREEAENRCD